MLDNSTMGIAMETMLFSAVKPLKVYNGQSKCPLPPGEKSGYGNALFLLAPSKIDADNLLQSGFVNYKSPFLYKHYMVDYYYREKIGPKHIVLNNTGIYKKQFTEMKISGMRQVMYNDQKSTLETTPNLIVNLGNWHELFFKWRYKKSIISICEEYINFLGKRINDSLYMDYNKILLVDMAMWFDGNTKKLGFDKDSLNDPISIFLTMIYKYSKLLSTLGKFTLVIANSTGNSFVKIDYSDMVPEKYNIIKSRILQMRGVTTYINEETINNDGNNIKSNQIEITDPVTAEDPTVNRILTKFKEERAINENNARNQILSTIKKNLIGDVEDITPGVMDDFDSMDSNEYRDVEMSEYNDEIDSTVNSFLDDNPDLLSDIDEAVSKAENEVKKKVYIAKFTPERSVKKLEDLKMLQDIQDQVLNAQSYSTLQSKIIDETDRSNAVKTGNINILKSKFANFDRSYNNKKLEKDIDDAVAILSKASTKVFVTSKSEEDTSDQLTLKRTLTYNLKDENGHEMKLKFDVPIIIEDRYLWMNGSKKEIHHQLLLKPIVKIKPDTVQIVALYNKVSVNRHGANEFRTTALRKYLLKHTEDFKLNLGNASIMNGDYTTSMEFDMIAKYVYDFTIGNNVFINDIHKLLSKLDKLGIKYDSIDTSKYLIIGYNKSTKSPIFIDLNNDSYAEKIIGFMPIDNQNELKNSIRKTYKSRFMYTKAEILEESVPVIVLLLHFEGFKSVMEKAKIEYKFISDDDMKSIDPYEWGLTKLADGYIAWKRYPIENSLLMNGLVSVPLDLYNYKELESKDTYIAIMSQFFDHVNASYNVDQFQDFMIDDITKEILIDHNLPTDLVSIFIYVNKLLTTNAYIPTTNMLNMRLRSNEIIAACTYKAVTGAYNVYRKSQYKKKPKPISIKQNDVMNRLYKSGLIEDESILNPILQLSKSYGVTYKGERGIGLDKAMTLDKRAYNESMLGVLGITTSPDAGVGINRQLTFEPNITSTRGYIDVVGKPNVDELSGVNLLTAAEMLTPLGVQHDDPARTAINV